MAAFLAAQVRMRDCSCSASAVLCTAHPWKRSGIENLDFSLRNEDACEVDEKTPCYFKALGRTPTNEPRYFSYEPCGAWRNGEMAKAAQALANFCQLIKAVTLHAWIVYAMTISLSISVGIVFCTKHMH